MKYLQKIDASEIVEEEWTYDKKSDRPKIKRVLLEEQQGFCAYSERYVGKTDAVDIEHFDPRIKNTTNDNYRNWYAVLHWLNIHKPKLIVPHLPILHPSAADLSERIIYEDGLFQIVEEGDTEAENLINFLGWNKPEVVEDRQKHVQRIQFMKEMLNDNELFLNQLRNDKMNLSFATALEVELGIDVDALLA